MIIPVDYSVTDFDVEMHRDGVGMAARTWGFWTRGKLDILRAYLDAFTTAAQRSPELIYIDVFAGTAENRDRLTQKRIEGSARIALSIDSRSFTKLRFFESAENATSLRDVLQADFPNRDFLVIAGDSNEEVPKALRALAKWVRAPTFAFIDPNGMEAEWRALKALADFRRNEKTKVELFYLFSPPMFQRLLRVDGTDVRPQDIDAIDLLFGTHDWYIIYQARLSEEIDPAEARERYLNLMRWRMENELGYKWTHSLEVKNERGSPIYYLIFATDHQAGDKIMRHIFTKAAETFPQMREEAQQMRRDIEREATGVEKLFDDSSLRQPPEKDEGIYLHQPPWNPYS
ncbi:three-Cys-motif partner protein TcmP [Candidatus Poriferisodalis sp.]|uniref:three-Cys-motif partner protein TcmP n=1 Tax=Candidatus Poriferisodalis sp. TaxID=3101277 RepID=UPI003B0195A2